MQRAQKMNNIVEASMRRQLEQFERQRDNSITLIDQDRLDIHDFLKNLKKCPSEELPETRHWLGNRTPSGRRVPRTTRLTLRNQSAPANAEQEAEARQAELARQEQLQEYELMGFRSSRPKPELVQRTMALQRLFSKRNLYAGMTHTVEAFVAVGLPDAPSASPAAAAAASSATPQAGTAARDMLESRGNVTFKDSGPPDPESRAQLPEVEREGEAFSGRLPRADGGEAEATKAAAVLSKSAPAGRRQECGRPGCHGHHHVASREPHEDFMKELLVGKYRKKRKKTEPLQDRIESFFQRMEMIKRDERNRSKMPSQAELHRRWVALTRGVKVALAESSDEEDANPDHTL